MKLWLYIGLVLMLATAGSASFTIEDGVTFQTTGTNANYTTAYNITDVDTITLTTTVLTIDANGTEYVFDETPAAKTEYEISAFNVTNLYDNINEINITDFTLTLSNSLYSTTRSTTTGSVIVHLYKNQEYDLVLNASGYALIEETLTPNTDMYYYTYESGVYTEDTLLFYVYDEITGDLLVNVTFTIQLVGDLYAKNDTTVNGTLTMQNVTPDTYEIRYFSTDIDDYKLRSYFTTLGEQSYQQLDLYALNDTSTDITSATITFVVYDQDLDPVENARVTVSRYYIDNNAFLQVFSRDTNTLGQAVGTFETIDAFYQYQVKINNLIYYTSSSAGTQFSGTATIPIYINIGAQSYETSQTFDSIPASLRYVNTSSTTGYVEYNWTWDTSLPVCLYVDEVSVFGSGFSDSTCVNGAAGSIQLAIDSESQTKDYVAQAYINYDQQGYKIHDQLSFTVNLQSPLNNDNWKDIATLISLFALLMSWFIGLRYPAVSIVIMSGIFVILTLPPLRLITITTSIGMWTVAVAILLLIKLRGGSQ